MFQKRLFSKSLTLIIFILCFAATGWTQSSTSLFWEPEVEVEIRNETPWFHSFGASNRTLYFQKVDGEKVAGQNQEHLELSHFTGYMVNESSRFSLGIRYRFVEAFNEPRHDELRFIQQYNFSAPDAFMDMGHRIRAEQRLREENVLRLRYQIGFAQPLGEVFEVGFATETLYSIGAHMAPELDQRASIGISNTSFRNLEISVGFEYQYENYLHTPEAELFIQSGLTLEL